MTHEDGRSPIARLADAAGVLPGYVDQTGRRRETSDASRRALLAALGHAVRDDDDARGRLDALDAARRHRLAPTRVVAAEETGALRLALHADAGAAADWRVEIGLEDGEARVIEGRGAVGSDGSVSIGHDEGLPLGYHTLRASGTVAGTPFEGTQRLIVVPPRCPSPAALLRGERVFGLTASLYTVRSSRNWGVGDLTDLASLLEFGAGQGAAFVGVNPLHALRNADGDVSPYSPVSRLFRNPLYLDVEIVPELEVAPEARALVARITAGDALRRLRDGTRVEYAAVMALKTSVLELLHCAFRERAGEARRAAYHAYLAREGEALERFARFQALDAHFRPSGAGWWREWPAEFRDAGSHAVDAFAREHAERVDYHRWLQFEIDRQLGDAARRGRAAGMPIGVYEDLAIGASPSGSDVWASPGLFVEGVCVGAPPDPLGPEGQNWGLPPVDPHALHASGYAHWTALVRGAFRHAGALRIDHVLGLFRQFWIPEGMSGAEGAYVRFPTDDLFGILALEATRVGALVVGEDLGTVPPEVPPTLARWGVLSSKVLYFEHEHDGAFRSPRHYPRASLATANTHDLAPLAGWWRGRDLELRREVGLLADDDALAEARRERARDRMALVALLVDEGLLDADPSAGAEPSELAIRAGVHALLRRSPAWLVGLSLDDLVGEAEPVNVPGVGHETFPCWTRRLSVAVEQLATDRAVRRALGAEREWVP